VFYRLIEWHLVSKSGYGNSAGCRSVGTDGHGKDAESLRDNTLGSRRAETASSAGNSTIQTSSCWWRYTGKATTAPDMEKDCSSIGAKRGAQQKRVRRRTGHIFTYFAYFLKHKFDESHPPYEARVSPKTC